MPSKLLATVAIAVLFVLLCNAFAQQRANEPKPIPADNHIGRYQITGLNSSNVFVLVDTHTGQCWLKSQTQMWHDQGTPVK